MNTADGTSDGDPAIHRLRESLVAPDRSAGALHRIEQALQDEFQQLYAEPSPRSGRGRWRIASVAIVLVLVGAAALAMFRVVGVERPVVATLSNGLSGSLRAWTGGLWQPLVAGAPLRAGDWIESQATGELLWLHGGRVRLHPGTRVRLDSDTDLRLEAGSIYVDMSGPHDALSLRVVTRLARIEHVGTRYQVSVDPADTAVQVRDGAVRVIGASTTPVRNGDELRLDSAGGVHQRHLPADDPVWRWVDAPLYAFDPEGRPVQALLEWVSQENGRPLNYASDAVRARAARTILHGSIGGLSVEQAAEFLLATTTLRARIRDGAIDVVAAPTTDTPPRR